MAAMPTTEAGCQSGSAPSVSVNSTSLHQEAHDDKVQIEGFLLFRKHLRHRRYCVLRGRNLFLYSTKEEAQKHSANPSVGARKQIVVVAAKEALSLDPVMRVTLLGRTTKPKHVERALVISTQKSKIVVAEADTPTEKLRWLHALSTLNLASAASERALCLSMLDDDKCPFDAHLAVSLLHKYRNNALMIELVIERLEAYVETNVDDVEFYIPQIMHLLLNADVVKTDTLVTLLLSICRAKSYVEHLGNSIHLALQLFWLLEAKIQDHEPKTYNLCAQLLMSIEAKVVNQHLEISNTASEDSIKNLLAKIPGIKTMLDQSEDTSNELRVPLPLSAEGVGYSLPPPVPSAQGERDQRVQLLRWIENERKKRYRYFHEQRDFVKVLTDISEQMRAIEPPSERKKHLPDALRELKIPDMAYIPLGKVSDPFARITRVLPDEGTVFSTHSRAPCLLCFEVIEDSSTARVQPPPRSASTSAMMSRTNGSPLFSSARANSTNSAGSIGGATSSAVVLDEESLVSNIIKKLTIAGTILNIDDSSLSAESSVASQTDSSTIGVPMTKRDSEASSVNPLDEVFEASVKDLERSWTATADEAGSTEDVKHGSLSFSAAVGACSPVAAGTHGDPCHIVRRQSKAAYDGGLSKLLAESGVFGESWAQKKERIRAASPYGSQPGWNVISLISKSNDDIRQEVFAMQLISKFQHIFCASQLLLWLRPYSIVSTGRSSGLLETITDAQSFDALKKHKEYEGLRKHFEKTYGHGDVNSPAFKTAQRNFLHSLVAYSLVCYLLQIKDRHNGNMLLDTQGHIVHIDFGFMLGIAPGGAWSFETAPFKLTKEMVEVLGGVGSPLFGEFVRLLALGMLAAQRHADQITTLVEIMMQNSTFPCFKGRDVMRELHKLRERFLPNHSPEETVKAIVKMVQLSYRNKWTKRYDQFQKLTNGIVP